jgi:hypothetical protein
MPQRPGLRQLVPSASATRYNYSENRMTESPAHDRF